MKAGSHSSQTLRRLHPRRKLLWMVSGSALCPLLYAAACGPVPPLIRLNAAFAAEAAVDRRPTYTVTTHRQSYFQLDENGGLVEQDGLPIRAENIYHLQRTIDPEGAAIVVMDPWIDMASDHLNEYYGRIAESHVVPLVNRGLERGHRIIVLTNDPAVVKYNTRIHPKLAALVAEQTRTGRAQRQLSRP